MSTDECTAQIRTICQPGEPLAAWIQLLNKPHVAELNEHSTGIGQALRVIDGRGILAGMAPLVPSRTNPMKTRQRYQPDGLN